MRIYTRKGDSGETGLIGGPRVSKTHPRVEAYGDVDELNAAVGLALAMVSDPLVRERLASVQPDLFVIGARLAEAEARRGRGKALPELPDSRIRTLESWIDDATAGLPELRAFILPGGTPGGAAIHLARTICRRAERRVVALAAQETVDDWILAYMNRLSDLLFVLARLENHRAGSPEIEWHAGAEPAS